MLKHGLLSSADDYADLLKFDILNADLEKLLPLLEKSVKVKERIVEEDPMSAEYAVRSTSAIRPDMPSSRLQSTRGILFPTVTLSPTVCLSK